MAWYDVVLQALDRALDWLTASNARRWLLFVLLLLATWILAHLASRLVTRRLVRLRRVEPAVVQLLGSLFVFLAFLISVLIYAKTVFDADVVALGATLGLVSLAIGFGFQNTIANVAGGISLALDRPFRLGDQIRVGDLVGDVQEIGIRSTRILTRRREFIVIPNKYLESEPITNYTMVYPEFRLDVPVNVMAEVDRNRVEEIMVEVALAHPVVLRRPPPRVLVRQFLGSVLHLELRAWISHPRDRTLVASDLLKSIHDWFLAEDIPIPGRPRGTADGAKTRAARGFVRTPQATRRLLVPLVDADPSTTRASYAVALAKALRGQLVGVYVMRTRGSARTTAEDGGRALHVLETMAADAGIWFKPILRETDDPEAAVVDAAKDEDIDLVVLGVGRGRSAMEWGWRREAPALRADALRRGLTAVVHEMPADARLNPATVEGLNTELARRRPPERPHGQPSVVVSPPEPRTSAVPSPPPERAAERSTSASEGEAT